jgi:hypothetical protein
LGAELFESLFLRARAPSLPKYFLKTHANLPIAEPFNLDSYFKTHIPLEYNAWSKYGLTKYQVVKLAPESGYSMQCIMSWESAEGLGKALKEEGAVVMMDMKNFSTETPRKKLNTLYPATLIALVSDNCGLYSEEAVGVRGQKQTAVKSPPSTAVQKVSCPKCGKRMLLESLRAHKRLAHGPRLLANCTVYRKSLLQRNMKQHMQLHSGEKVNCNTCGMQFLREGNLERHEKTTDACEQYKYKLSLTKENVLENGLEDEERNGENEL